MTTKPDSSCEFLNKVTILTNPDEFNFNFIYDSLMTAYWASGRTFSVIEKSFRNSLSKMIYVNNEPAGFGRVVTDYAIFAYVADIFISEKYRGHGLGKILLDKLMFDESLAEVSKWMLVTADMHTLYTKYGFRSVKYPERYMEFFPFQN